MLYINTVYMQSESTFQLDNYYTVCYHIIAAGGFGLPSDVPLV